MYFWNFDFLKLFRDVIVTSSLLTQLDSATET